MREFGSFAVFALVSFFFMPSMRAQKESRRLPPSGWGAFRPGLPGFALLYEARPLAFKPPFGFLPSLRVHAGDLGIKHRHFCIRQRCINAGVAKHTFCGDQDVERLAVCSGVDGKKCSAA